MNCFVFRSEWDANLVSYLRRARHETIQEMIQFALQDSTSETVDDPDDTARGDDAAVIEHLENAIRNFIFEDAASTGLTIDADPSDFYGYVIHDVIERIDFRRVARAIYYGVDPDIDGRNSADPDLISDIDNV